jgi:hypothetical protein
MARKMIRTASLNDAWPSAVHNQRHIVAPGNVRHTVYSTNIWLFELLPALSFAMAIAHF